ncbi:MAG TPA: L-threonylcarbamoyladenylate synthase [Pyrinomonadaceae bacterium]|nr:L-threonylcarbamoyladenylate synthase [Pyrinomonadaceae bacterium]
MSVSQTIQSLAQIAEVVFGGGVIAFRTDTFYGLGADPFNREAVKRIKKLKEREGTKPILVIISDQDQIERFIVERSESFESLAQRFWPGPLTLIGKAAAGLPGEITAGTGTVGLRLPDDQDVRALLRACGGALTATSANPSNENPAKSAQHVENYFGSTIDLIVDGGDARVDRPSTVVDVTGVEPKLVREGVILWSEIVE